MNAAVRSLFVAVLTAFLLLPAPIVLSYPLDGFPSTGIIRLEAYRLASQGKRRPSFLTEGEMLPSAAISLGLLDNPGFKVPAPDPEISAKLREMLGADAGAYGVTLLDWSDPKRPIYAAHQPDYVQNPGSVGKIAVLLGWFSALADLYPDDVSARRALLYETEIVANDFIQHDSHDVPFWSWSQPQVDRRPIQIGDRGNVWTWLDWMASASSNAAASMLISELVLLRHFGQQYPVPADQAAALFRDTPKSKLSRMLSDAIQKPLSQAGMDLTKLRQGSLFTRRGKAMLPGTNSVSTARELTHYLLLMEQGKLVDPWSSLEIKKLLYLTDSRIRYAASPVLEDSAVYFKSGSLYSCRTEKGYQCGKFLGNRLNYMNSVVIIESIDRSPAIKYSVVVLSNVLKKDSSDIHQALGRRVHALIQSLHPSTKLPFLEMGE